MSKTLDWSVLALPEVDDIAQQAAIKVATGYAHAIEYDDAYQEALILLAGRADRVRAQVDVGHLGLVQHELDCDLVNQVETEARHRSTHMSLERLREARTQ